MYTDLQIGSSMLESQVTCKPGPVKEVQCHTQVHANQNLILCLLTEWHIVCSAVYQHVCDDIVFAYRMACCLQCRISACM